MASVSIMIFLFITRWSFFNFYCCRYFLYLFLHKNNPFERSKIPYYLSIGEYCVLTLLSAILSEYSHVAFFGIRERYEGAIVLLAYSVILFLSMNVFSHEKSIQILFGCLLASTAIISVIGIFNISALTFSV